MNFVKWFEALSFDFFEPAALWGRIRKSTKNIFFTLLRLILLTIDRQRQCSRWNHVGTVFEDSFEVTCTVIFIIFHFGPRHICEISYDSITRTLSKLSLSFWFLFAIRLFESATSKSFKYSYSILNLDLQSESISTSDHRWKESASHPFPVCWLRTRWRKLVIALLKRWYTRDDVKMRHERLAMRDESWA